MDTISRCASNFRNLEQYEYKFVIARKGKQITLKVNFKDEDFSHLAGLHYLTDIQIPKNKKTTIKNILDIEKITDDLLQKSSVYNNPSLDKNIPSRIQELTCLEEYLDNDSYIRIYQNGQNTQSLIRADFFIETRLYNHTTYIFLAKRDANSDYYRINSIFQRGSKNYVGTNWYWLLKLKMSALGYQVLFQHKDYTDNKESHTQ